MLYRTEDKIMMDYTIVAISTITDDIRRLLRNIDIGYFIFTVLYLIYNIVHVHYSRIEQPIVEKVTIAFATAT